MGSERHKNEATSRRMTWLEVTPMPGNPTYGKRVDRMRKNGPGYQRDQVGRDA